jgi:integrase
MSRSVGGVVLDTRRKSPVFALRFRAYGRRQYMTLGSVADGWSRERAEQALRHTLADVERGIWRPPDREPLAAPEQPQDPTFHEFASRWFADNKAGWRPNTRDDYEWQLSSHLLPFFQRHRLSQITIAEVDRYRSLKVRQGVLSATSINKTITRLAQILEVAVEYGLINSNPAKGKRRRVKASRPAPVWLDRAEHIAALLDAAGELDARARRDRRHVARRPMLATLVFAGLRIGELLDLRWRDVDIAGGRITVRASKTDAGMRQVDMLPVLRDELLAFKAGRRHDGPNDRVFGTRGGGPQNPSNVRNRVLAPAVTLANERLEEAGDVPLPERLTPHKLRHTFASLLVALGVDPGSVMDQLGHTDPAFTLRVYRHGMRRDQASRDALRTLVTGGDWAAPGSSASGGPQVRALFAGVGHEKTRR